MENVESKHFVEQQNKYTIQDVSIEPVCLNTEIQE